MVTHSKKGMGSISAIMGIVLVIVVIGSAAVPILKAVNTSAFTATELTIYGLSTLFLILGGVVLIINTMF